MKEPTVPDNVSFSTVKKIACGVALLCLVEAIMPQAYGKLNPGNAVAQVHPKLGWWLMEAPVTFVFGYLFWIKGQLNSRLTVPIILGLVLSGHYLYRGWYYPLSLRVHPESKSGFSLVTALGGWLVTTTHGYLNAKWFGLVIYYTGFFLIVQQDGIMRAMRDKPGARRYEIPYGGVWEYSTSANYLVELVAWFGFWMLSDFGPNGAFIFFVSLFNLVPRAVTNYNWYCQQFGEEFTSLNRAILIPGVW